MNDAINPKVAAETARDTYRKTAAQFQELAGNTEVPEAMRALVENNITKTRELYERSKDALEALLESWERSFDAVGQGAVALNRKVIDIAQRNINSSFDLAKSLAGAKNLAEAMELQGAYWRKQLDPLAAQAEEVRTLSTQVAADAAKPIKRGMDEFKKAR
jgi:phasin